MRDSFNAKRKLSRSAEDFNLSKVVHIKSISEKEKEDIQLQCSKIEEDSKKRKELMKHQKIWQKRTKSILKPVSFKKFHLDYQGMSNHRDNKTESVAQLIEAKRTEMSKKDGLLVQTALKSIIERREEKAAQAAQNRQSIYEKVEKTKEIHLIRLTAQIVSKEIENCQKKAEKQFRAVHDIERAVKDDKDSFLAGFNAKKLELVKQEEKIRDLGRKKNSLISTIKDKNAELQSLCAENRKSIELVEGLRKLRLFIDKLTPQLDIEKRESSMFTNQKAVCPGTR